MDGWLESSNEHSHGLFSIRSLSPAGLLQGNTPGFQAPTIRLTQKQQM